MGEKLADMLEAKGISAALINPPLDQAAQHRQRIEFLPGPSMQS